MDTCSSSTPWGRWSNAWTALLAEHRDAVSMKNPQMVRAANTRYAQLLRAHQEMARKN